MSTVDTFRDRLLVIADAALGIADTNGDVIWRRCTPACRDNVQCHADAVNENIGWGTCAETSCRKLADGTDDTSLNADGITTKCGWNSGKIWGWEGYVASGAQGGASGAVNRGSGNRNQCRCCQGLHDWGRRDQGEVSQHFACRFPA